MTNEYFKSIMVLQFLSFIPAALRIAYQQVQVRKRSRVSVGMRAKDDYSFGLELACNRIAYLADLLRGSHLPRVSHRTSGAARALSKTALPACCVAKPVVTSR